MKPEIPVDGHCEPGFEAVKESFRKNFTEGWELGGAAFAVYYQGKKVVDLWGGWAEKKYNRLWREDTLSTIFSCTKGISAICIAILVDRGICDYSDLVTKYWPEFGQNGKESITIEMLISHKAGLPFLDTVYTLEMLQDPEALAKVIEAQMPAFPPGTKTAYQALSYGHVLDCLFRKIEPKSRGIGQFFREEVADKHHIDLHIGDCAQEESRLTRIMPWNPRLAAREFMYDRKIAIIAQKFYNPKGNMAKEMKSMKNFGKDFTLYNNPDTRIAAQPAVNGISTARALAQTYQLFMEGSLISPRLFDKLVQPVFASEMDHTLGETLNKGHGFMYTHSPKGEWQFGHLGAGGQNVKIDPKQGLVIAYLTNAMKAASGDHVFTYNRLQRQVYSCLDNIKKE